MAENENDISGKVSLDLTNFKANISALNQQIRVIDTGFRASAAGMADWGSNADGLQARIKSLSEIIELQKQKVDNLKEVYAKVAAEKGENSKAAQDLLIRINNETTALNKNLTALDAAKGKLAALTAEETEAEKATKAHAEAQASLSQEINTLKSDLSLQRSEFKLLDEAYRNGGKSADELLAVQKNLSEQAETQKKIVDKLKDAITESTKATGDDSEETKKLKIALNDMQSGLIQTVAAAGKCNDELNLLSKKETEAEKAAKANAEVQSVLASEVNSLKSTLAMQRSEFNLLDDTYKDNKKSSEAFKSAQSSLSSQLDTQRSIVKKLSEAVRESAKYTGEDSDETKKLKTALNEAKSQLNQTENAVDNYGKDLDDAGKKTLSFGDILKANVIGDAIIGGLRAIGTAIKSAYNALKDFVSEGLGLASNLTEVQNVVDTTFGENSAAIDKFAKSAANAFGMSELAVKQYSGTMGAMLKSMGLTSNTVTDMSTALVGLAGDMASFYNLDASEAFEKLRAGIAGETEPLKQLGINMSVANLEAYALAEGITKSYKDMTQAEQATLRYNYIMKATADAQGDFAKTSDSFANQQRILKLNMDNAAASIGEKFLPGITDMTKAVNGLLSGDINADEFASQLLAALDGMLAQINKMLPAYIAKGTAIVSALTSGIIKTLPTILDAAASILTALITGIIDALPTLVPAATDIILQLVTTLISMLPDIIEAGLQIIIQLALGLAQALPTLIPAIVDVVILIAETLIDNIDLLVDASIAIMVALSEGLIEAMPRLIERIPEIIVKLVEAIIVNTPKMVEAGFGIMFALGNAMMRAIGEMLSKISEVIKEIVKSFGLGNGNIKAAGRNMIENLWNGIKESVAGIKEKISGWVNGILTFFRELPAKIGEQFTSVLTGFSQWAANAAAWVAQAIPNIINAILNFFNELPGKIGYALGYAIRSIIKWGKDAVDWVTTNVPIIINNIVTFFTELPGKLLDILTNALTNVKQWGVDIVSWITTNVPIFISSIVTFFTELPGKLLAVLTAAINTVKQWGSDILAWIGKTIPGIISNIVSFFSELPGKIVSAIGSVVTAIGTWASGIITKVKTELPKVISSITDFFAGLPDKMLEIGGNIVTGLWNGIKNAVSWLKQKIKEFADGVLQGIKDALGIASPSRVMADKVGQWIPAGIAKGITDKAGIVKSAMAALSSQLSGSQTLNATVSDGAASSGGGYGLATTNLYLDSNQLLSVTSPVQYNRNSMKAQARGVLLA